MSEEQAIELHPCVEIIGVDERKVQLRAPDGFHLTINEDSNIVNDVLKRCNGINTSSDITSGYSGDEARQKTAAALLALLKRKNLIVSGNESIRHDPLFQAIDFYSRKTKPSFRRLQPTKSGEPIEMIDFKHVQIEGEGAVSDAARAVARDLDAALIDQQESQKYGKSLLVCCCDSENLTFLRGINEKYLTCSTRPVLFLYVTGMVFQAGPLVIPGQTACFECAYHRSYANISHRPEHHAYTEHCRNKDSAYAVESPYIQGLIKYIVGVVMGCIQGQVFTHIDPGHIIRFNMATLEVERNRVTRLPRCTVCGVTPERQVPMAVRNII